MKVPFSYVFRNLWTRKLTTMLTAGGLFTTMVKMISAEVSTPPLAVPPLSCKRTRTLAVPKAFAAGV